MQSEALTTLTARYSLREDRIVVDGVIHTGDELQLVFTQRLARALVAELVRQVSARTKNPLMHDFAQDEATSTKPQSDAVQVAGGLARDPRTLPGHRPRRARHLHRG